ncbi:MAG: PASTA domain-containing protein, partial [Actinomycetota bacterium]
AVTIQVSNGKGEPVVVPRVTGLSEKDAVEALEDAGLVAAIERTPVQDPALNGVVVEQIPIGNKVVDVGATVTIRVGEHDSGNGNDNDGGGDDGGGDGPDDAGRRRR